MPLSFADLSVLPLLDFKFSNILYSSGYKFFNQVCCVKLDIFLIVSIDTFVFFSISLN